ncbi:MAG: hypothetical protein K5768_00140, partial [Firmicutes bacterium]|nr:hypothetical protein [Bacillota bacterium]
AIEKSGVSPESIEGISISSQGISVVPVDGNANPLDNAISWLDTRAEKEAELLKTDFGEEKIREITGKPYSSVYTLPKILWLKKNKPEIYQKAYKFLMPLDFLTAKLTGNFVTDHSMASGTLMYDLQNACWCDEILAKYDIDKEKLPKLAYTGEVAGCVIPEIRKELGLKETCIVAVGAQDQKCAAFGVGLDFDSITISLGTAAAVTKLWKKLKNSNIPNVTWCGYLEPNTWVTEGVVATAGTCLRWVRDTFYTGEKYGIIDKEAEYAIKNGNNLVFLPFMSGQGAFYGLSLSDTRANFAACVIEGVAFEIRALLESMNAYEEKRKIILFGGGAKSDLWCRVIADVTGMEICVPSTEEAAGAGAARATAKACGSIIKPLSCNRTYKPNRNYDEQYRKYLLLRSKDDIH